MEQRVQSALLLYLYFFDTEGLQCAFLQAEDGMTLGEITEKVHEKGRSKEEKVKILRKYRALSRMTKPMRRLVLADMTVCFPYCPWSIRS